MNIRSVAWILAPALTFTACSSAPIESTGQDEPDALTFPAWGSIPVILPLPAATPACGSGNLRGSLSLTTDAQPGWSTWFGGDNRPPPPVNFHPRNVAYGVKIQRPYDSVVSTLGFSATGGFRRATDGASRDVYLQIQVRDANGTILARPPQVRVPASFTGGWIDLPVNTFVQKNTARIFTMYVDSGLTSGMMTGLQARPSNEAPDATTYSATVAVYNGSQYASESKFTSVWSPLWSPGQMPLRFRYSGCQEICGATSCDDNDACTVDSCDAQTGACLHTPLSCDDGVGCTVDACDSVKGCGHTPDVSLCPDQPFCNSAKVCNPKTGCGVDCSDGSICTADLCDQASDQCVHEQTPVPVNAADVSSSWDITMMCGSTASQGGFTCELSQDGQLRLAPDSQGEGGADYVTSGCSDNGDEYCCFR